MLKTYTTTVELTDEAEHYDQQAAALTAGSAWWQRCEQLGYKPVASPNPDGTMTAHLAMNKHVAADGKHYVNVSGKVNAPDDSTEP